MKQQTLKEPKAPRETALLRRRPTALRIAVLAAFALGFGILEPPAALAQTVPAKLQAAIILKVLNYDRAMKSRSSKSFRILIVTDSKTADQASELAKAFATISGRSVQGITLETAAHEYKDASKLESAIGSGKISAVYLPEGIARATFEAVKKLADKIKIPTFGGHADLVEKGLAIGIGVDKGKPKIVVNLPVMRKSGMDLSSNVLKLARVIK